MTHIKRELEMLKVDKEMLKIELEMIKAEEDFVEERSSDNNISIEGWG